MGRVLDGGAGVKRIMVENRTNYPKIKEALYVAASSDTQSLLRVRAARRVLMASVGVFRVGVAIR